MSDTPSSTSTPVMQQYLRAKAELDADTILFFRLGDFYEMFSEDAITASSILGLTLTKRQNLPMCGVPYHAAELYLSKLIRAGKKVALCDQMEDPRTAKGLVKREITGIVSPGTVLNDAMLDAARPNYLACLLHAGALHGLAMLDLSTGSFWMEEAADPAPLLDELVRYAPPELLLPESLAGDAPFMARLRAAAGSFALAVREDWMFDPPSS
jgi:DNA mismatch repair protein MutS